MKRKYFFISLFFLGLVILLELYPKTIIISRIATPKERFVNYYSYFSTMPYWNQNKFPLITALFSLGYLFFVLIKCCTKKEKKIVNILTLIMGILVILFALCSLPAQQNIFIPFLIFLFSLFSLLFIFLGIRKQN